MVFRKCLYFHARLLAPLLRLIKPDYFERDLRFAHYFGNATDWRQATFEIQSFCYEDHIQPSFARTTLRLRVSGRKANEVVLKFFPLAGPEPVVQQPQEQPPQPARQAGGMHP
jgi:hypothetical protein